MSADSANSKLGRIVGGALLLVMVFGASWWWSIRIERTVNPPGTPGIAPEAQAPQLPGDKRLAAWVQQLQMQVARQPDDVATWRLLAQTQAARGDMAQSAAAWQRALALAPRHADSHAGLAQALAALQQGRLSGEPATWIESGMKVAADHPALLALAGELALERGEAGQAVQHFERLLAVEQASASAPQNARLQAIRARLDAARAGRAN